MQDSFHHNDEYVSHTNYERSRDFLAVNGNAESYKTSFTYESLGIFSN